MKTIMLILGFIQAMAICVMRRIAKWFTGVKKWFCTFHVSPWTQYVCDKIILDAVKRTTARPWYKKFKLTRWLTRNRFPKPVSCALYPLAKKDKSAGGALLSLIGGEESNISLPPGYGHVMWPDPMVRCTADAQAKRIAEGMDGSIVLQIAAHTKATDRLTFKKCMTSELIEKAYEMINDEAFSDSDGRYLLCVTSRDRIETQSFTRDGGGWEDVEIYGDYIDRPLYPGEYGRLRLFKRFYVVFLTTLDNRMMFNLLFGPDAITVTPLEKNLRTTFRRTEAGEEGMQPRGYDMGFLFKLGAVADLNKCVVLEATKRIGGKE
jgi:hypothetical protein